MSKFEKAFVIFTLLYMAVYTFFFFNIVPSAESFDKILPFHLFGMALSLVFIIIIIRDIYKRDFENPNSKTTWTLLVILFWPSVFVYLPKYGFKSRNEIAKSGSNKAVLTGILIIIFCFFGFIVFSFFKVSHIARDDIQMLAVSGKIDQIVKLLSQNPEYAKNVRENDKWSPLHGAAYNNHPEIVKILANYGADPNLKTCNGDTALHGASEYGYTDVVRVLLNAGADPTILNDKGRTALEIAVWNGHSDIVELLNQQK